MTVWAVMKDGEIQDVFARKSDAMRDAKEGNDDWREWERLSGRDVRLELGPYTVKPIESGDD